MSIEHEKDCQNFGDYKGSWVCNNACKVREDCVKKTRENTSTNEPKGNCVCRFADKGKCCADDEYLCPMEHDVEGLLKDIKEQVVGCTDGTRNEFAAIMTVGDLVRGYEKRRRGG